MSLNKDFGGARVGVQAETPVVLGASEVLRWGWNGVGEKKF